MPFFNPLHYGNSLPQDVAVAKGLKSSKKELDKIKGGKLTKSFWAQRHGCSWRTSLSHGRQWEQKYMAVLYLFLYPSWHICPQLPPEIGHCSVEPSGLSQPAIPKHQHWLAAKVPDLARKMLPPGLLSFPRRVQGKLLKKQVPPRWLSYSHSQPSTDVKGSGCWQCSLCQADTQIPHLPQSSSHQAAGLPSYLQLLQGKNGAPQRVWSRQDWEKHLMCVGEILWPDQFEYLECERAQGTGDPTA